MCSTCGCDPQPVSVLTRKGERPRLVPVAQDVLARNQRLAEANRERLKASGILALNVMSGPGAGKTTLLTQTIRALRAEVPMLVIEGDQLTERDAERIRQAGAPAYQINTGRGCHLDALGIGAALDHLAPPDGAILFIENIGNLVCPAEFDLGEARKVVVLSVTEGDDKPLKYAPMFAAADLLILNKIDLLPYVAFDVEACLAHARAIRPDLPVLLLSATREDGLAEWLAWLEAERALQGISTPR